jgi:glycolate dehydrogenase iron-sulfur subunit
MDPLQVALRNALERSMARPWRERVLRRVVFAWLFMDLRRLRFIARLLWLYQRSGAQWLARHLGVLKALRLEASERLLPRVSGHFLVPKNEMYGPPDGPRAAFFAGCVMSTALADIDRATLRVLERAGWRVHNPLEQGCCGALHAHSGDANHAMALARANIAAFERTDGPLVVNSAGCGAMLKDYAHHLRDDPAWKERAAAFSARVRDLSEVLAERMAPPRHAVHKRVAYQDACHLLHAQRISRQPREVLRQIPEVELVEFAEAGLCCGSAGVYNVTNPLQSRQLQQRKLDNALAAAPDVIVTANPGCLLQLRSGLAERCSKVEVKHLAEILDEASV